MFKKLGLIICLLFSIYGMSQVDATVEKNKNGRWVIGGGFGLGFTRGFNIQANPEVGYRMKNLELGISPGISYQKYNGTDDFYDPSFKTTMWNVGPYVVYAPIPQFFFRGQYQYYSGELNVDSDYYIDNKFDENALWLGGGYQERIANHVYMRLGIMYNVLYDADDSIFSTGWIPIFGVSVGL